MKTTLLRYCCAFILLFGAFSCSEDESPTAQPTNEISITNEILKLVNEYRQSKGLSILEKSETAEQLATEHTQYMISKGGIGHDNIDDRFKVLKEKENATGFAENVAAGQNSAQSVMNSWINSTKGHRENLEGNYTHIGIAAIQNENGTYYYTQLFYR